MLHRAAEKGKSSIVYLLIQGRADLSVEDKEKWTALHYAAREGHLETVELLAEHGAALDGQNVSGWTPLYLAAFNGHSSVTKTLLQNMADHSVKDWEGKTALDASLLQAAEKVNGCVECVAYLQELQEHEAKLLEASKRVLQKRPLDLLGQDAQLTLHMAIEMGHLKLVEQLLPRSRINERILTTQDDWTPLHLAAHHGKPNIVQWLLQMQCNSNVLQKSQTALHWAAFGGHYRVASLLVEHSAKLDLRTEDTGTSPLHLAASEGNLDIVDLLLSARADVDVRQTTSETALQLSIFQGHCNVAKLLISHGANLNLSTKQGLTALHVAARDDNSAILALLVERRAVLDAQTTPGGWTPLHMAAHNGRMDTVMNLVEAGADLNVKNEEGKTALDVALELDGHMGQECAAYLKAAAEGGSHPAPRPRASLRATEPRPGRGWAKLKAMTQVSALEMKVSGGQQVQGQEKAKEVRFADSEGG